MIKDFPIVLPALDEQRKRANYLYKKCSCIDEIILKQRKIVEKLLEYKVSIITDAVTKGLNPNVEMKDSGILWLGNVPNSWQAKRLDTICNRPITYEIVKMGDYDENGVKALDILMSQTSEQ